MKPLISVVTASWNQGRYLGECIESVMGLDEGSVEHIIVDNCSDDETSSVLARYPHLRTLVEPDDGQVDALNKGFSMARGEWILWLNADDFLLPGVLAEYVETIAGNPEIDGVYGHMVFADAGSKPFHTVYQPQWHYFMIYYGSFCVPSTGTLYRASLLKESPLADDYHMIMDTEWTLRAGRGMKVKRLRRKSVAFRVTEDNKTSANIKSGEVTPRHKQERRNVTESFPTYDQENPTFLVKLIRRAVRIQILADKAVSRLLDQKSDHQSELS